MQWLQTPEYRSCLQLLAQNTVRGNAGVSSAAITVNTGLYLTRIYRVRADE